MRRHLGWFVAAALAVVFAVAVFLLPKPRPTAGGKAGQRFDYKPWPHVVPGGVPVRPMDADIFAAIEKGNISHAQLLDLFPDRPYHVKLVGNSAERTIGFVLIDLHRSGKWDEHWELKTDGTVSRRTLTDTEDSPSNVLFTLRAGYWVPH